MEAGSRCKDECLPEETNRRIVDIISDVNLAYSEHARRYLAECGLPKERTYVTGSPMAEVLHANLAEIEAFGYPQTVGPGEREIHATFGSPRREHRYGEEFPVVVQCHQCVGREIRHADPLQAATRARRSALSRVGSNSTSG